MDVAETQVLFADGDSLLYLAHYRAPGELMVFDADGTFRRVIGRLGDGPGEFRRISYVRAESRDVIEVFDRRGGSWTGRRTVLDRTGRVVSTHRLDAAVPAAGAVFLDDGSAVVATHVRSPGRVGFPLQHLGADGRILRSFGSETGAFDHSKPVTVARVLARSSPERVWSGHRSRYVIEEWDTAGVLHRVLTRDVAWFEPWDSYRPPTADEPPLSSLVAMKQDRAHRLWVLVHVPDRNWRAALPPPGREPELAELYDTMIEVIDPGSGELILSQRWPGYLEGFLDDETVFGFREDMIGYTYIDVLHIDFVPGPG